MKNIYLNKNTCPLCMSNLIRLDDNSIYNAYCGCHKFYYAEFTQIEFEYIYRFEFKFLSSTISNLELIISFDIKKNFEIEVSYLFFSCSNAIYESFDEYNYFGGIYKPNTDVSNYIEYGLKLLSKVEKAEHLA
ncbi:MAG: hypothetical protein LC122_12215 [Chitinophagales bacterium]|nr:hypothetical protein [Chitinophagales bacterium]